MVYMSAVHSIFVKPEDIAVLDRWLCVTCAAKHGYICDSVRVSMYCMCARKSINIVHLTKAVLLWCSSGLSTDPKVCKHIVSPYSRWHGCSKSWVNFVLQLGPQLYLIPLEEFLKQKIGPIIWLSDKLIVTEQRGICQLSGSSGRETWAEPRASGGITGFSSGSDFEEFTSWRRMKNLLFKHLNLKK